MKPRFRGVAKTRFHDVAIAAAAITGKY